MTHPQTSLRSRSLSLGRLGALALVAALVPATLLAAPAAAAPAAASVSASSSASGDPSRGTPSGYVALGDSFTAGQGAPPYAPGPCLQSAYKSYPSIAALVSPFRLVANNACSAAGIADVAGQLAGVSPRTALVTITVGGIDAGVAQVRAACADYPTEIGVPDCLAQVAVSQNTITTVLPVQLVTLYSTIAATLPNARIAVVGYPLIFEPGASPAAGIVNGGTQLLNSVIQGSVAATGNPSVAYVDPTQEFAGHGIGSPSPYIAFDPANPLAPANFHPNALGNALGYARALANDGILRRR